MSQIQAAVIVTGDLYILKVQCLHPGMMYLTGALTAFTFSLLIYSLAISFGDVGKAVVVVVMVLQIAGSSGTFPIELLPAIYQKIYRFFPFPYAIDAMRECICGLYGNYYWQQIGFLLLFAAAALLIGLLGAQAVHGAEPLHGGEAGRDGIAVRGGAERMSKEREYQELYDRLLEEVSTLHRNNRRRIRVGMRMLLAVTLGLMLLMFLAGGNKVFTLMLWILSMFAVAAYLIAVEYADYELQKSWRTSRRGAGEHGRTAGAAGAAPYAPAGRRCGTAASGRKRLRGSGRSRRRRRRRRKACRRSRWCTPWTIFCRRCTASPAETAYVPKRMQEPERVSAPEPEKQVAPVSGSGAAVWQKMLDDPEKLAGDLEKLTQALQGLSADLRRSAEESRKEDDR